MANRSNASKLGALKALWLPDDPNKPHLALTSVCRNSAKNAWWALGGVVRVGLGYESPTDPMKDPETGEMVLRVRNVPMSEMEALNRKVEAEVSLTDINDALIKKFQDEEVRRYCVAAPDNAKAKEMARETRNPSERYGQRKGRT